MNLANLFKKNKRKSFIFKLDDRCTRCSCTVHNGTLYMELLPGRNPIATLFCSACWKIVADGSQRVMNKKQEAGL